MKIIDEKETQKNPKKHKDKKDQGAMWGRGTKATVKG